MPILPSNNSVSISKLILHPRLSALYILFAIDHQHRGLHVVLYCIHKWQFCTRIRETWMPNHSLIQQASGKWVEFLIYSIEMILPCLEDQYADPRLWALGTAPQYKCMKSLAKSNDCLTTNSPFSTQTLHVISLYQAPTLRSLALKIRNSYGSFLLTKYNCSCYSKTYIWLVILLKCNKHQLACLLHLIWLCLALQWLLR